MPTQLPLSQRNITVSYDRRARERKRGGETFSKLSGNATHAFPASLVKRPTARKPINSQRFELRGTCFLQKLIRERMIGEGGVRGGGVGGGGILYDNSHPPRARQFPNNERGAKQTT